MSKGKRFLTTRAARVLVRSLARASRPFYDAGTLVDHDPALLALLRTREPAIFACWHQDFPWTLGYLSRHNRRRPTYVLASASRDGGLATAAAEGVGFRAGARGSSARDGARALRQLHRLASRGRASIVVVCDGPRPPAREMKPGILHLARETGLPIWLVRTWYAPARVLDRTWARFVLVAPWARAVVRADGPIRVPAGLDRDGLERWRAALEARLDRLVDRAASDVGARGPTP